MAETKIVNDTYVLSIEPFWKYVVTGKDRYANIAYKYFFLSDDISFE